MCNKERIAELKQLINDLVEPSGHFLTRSAIADILLEKIEGYTHSTEPSEEAVNDLANILSPFFNDPIDIPCPYCEAAKAVIKAGYTRHAEPKKHELIKPTDPHPQWHKDDSHCPICDHGLSICSICGKAEAELDLPCQPEPSEKSVEVVAKFLCLQDGLEWGWLKEQQRYCGAKDCEYYIRVAREIRKLQPEPNVLGWAKDHYWDSLEPQKDLIIKHLESYQQTLEGEWRH